MLFLNRFNGNLRKIIILFISAAIVSWFIVNLGFGTEVKPSPQLAPVEIKEYQGEKLSSNRDFRENSIKGPQYLDMSKYRLTVTGLVKTPKVYTYSDVTSKFKSYQKMVTLNCVEGWSVKIFWEGFLVKDILQESQPLPKGNTIIFYSEDGYSTSFPLSYIMDNYIMMADKINRIPLPVERGFPFELVAENKWGYKWIKWITKIEISDNTNYRGYWEQRGYSNSGDLKKGFFGK